MSDKAQQEPDTAWRPQPITYRDILRALCADPKDEAVMAGVAYDIHRIADALTDLALTNQQVRDIQAHASSWRG